jgi:hypothetical protein
MMSKLFSLGLLACLSSASCIWAQQDVADPAAFDPCLTLEENQQLFKPLSAIRLRLPPDPRRLPPDCSGYQFGARTSGNKPRFDKLGDFHWRPTDFFYMPVYFDNVPLERYGQTKSPLLEPVVSGLKFLVAVPALPYKIGVNRPHDCITTLGHQPPGDCVPCIRQTLPWELDAALLETGVALAMVFVLP